MRAITFFLVVFVSTLSIFLLTTGEVQRWFNPSPAKTLKSFDAPETPPDEKNLLYFPFYNTDRGVLGFTIAAELSQTNIGAGEKIDQIRQLTLRNGTLEIPVEGGLELAGGEGSAPATGGHIALRFETAEWEQEQKADAGAKRSKEPASVVLHNGQGQTADGYSFDFKKLLFHYSGSGVAENEVYEVRSTESVAIRSDAFELRSQNGLRGRLSSDGNGLDSLTFAPPVVAALDPERAPFFGANIEAAAPDGVADRASGRRLWIVSDGPLEFRMEEGKTRRTRIRFTKSVALYPLAAGATLEPSRRPAGGTRFECGDLELVFRQDGRRMVPESALAVRENGRVRSVFAHESGEEYVVEADQLEWRGDNPEKETAAGDGSKRAIAGEAILSGRPTLRGGGSDFVAKDARLRLSEGRLTLRDVEGTMALPKRRGKEAESPRIAPLDGSRATEETLARARLPDEWTMRAEEATFRFAEGEDGEREFSEFVAVSPQSGLVEVLSAASDDRSISLKSEKIRYDRDARELRFEGVRQPVLSDGRNTIEADRIRLLLEKDRELALFEGAVRAQIADVSELPAGVDASAGALKGRLGGGRGFELTSNELQVGFDPELNGVGYLRANGTARVPARVIELPEEGEKVPGLVLEGAQLELDQLKQRASVWGTVSEDAGGASRPRLAVLRRGRETLRAEQITFAGETGIVKLDRTVSLQSEQDRGELTIEMATAVVVLRKKNGSTTEPPSDGQAAKSGPPDGGILFEALRDVDTMTAEGDVDRPIVITAKSDGGRSIVARSQRAEWSGDKLELRLFGDERQQIDLADDRFAGPIHAREIVYEETTRRVVLRGDVKGELRQRHEAKENLEHVWTFATTRFDLHLERGEKGPELKSAHARGDVHLTDRRFGLQLLGDALDFDEATRRVRIFSPNGRPQTFYRLAPTAEGSEATRETPDKITAQEIVLQPHEDPDARFGQPSHWLLVRFRNDVKAVFHPPPSVARRTRGKSRGRRFPLPDEAWKLDTDEIVLYVDPSQGWGPKSVPWAICEGSVVFQSGDYTGTAASARYEEGLQKLTLRGRPVRLTVAAETFEGRSITVRRESDHVLIEVEDDGRNR